ncbi:MAG: 1-deoxy-D-xylulose-5-phosphate reductoisomerase [Neisseriaceae bacterium]|nr:1-deoxy-D-xylulose-5-phosphate reductoisomerase [Neisseriaceae bacterium]
MKKQNITILGATGSIGQSTLDILRQHPDKFSVFALTAYSQVEKLGDLCVQFSPQYAVINGEENAEKLNKLLKSKGCDTQVLCKEDALSFVATHKNTDMVMAAIVGAAGFVSAFAAAECGKKILLANKETLVMGGELFMATANANHAPVLPVDSEHNAVFQTLPESVRREMANGVFSGSLNDKIASILITASGGSFLHTPLNKFEKITPQMAVKHPKWSMGRKISVDSSTMMNKGLEVIEACRLFMLPADKIEVVIHPQSIIHGMTRYADGSILAQLGTPDMRVPIAHSLGLPERIASGVAPLDFFALDKLTFHRPDFERFPCLRLAFEALKTGGAMPCILNAANEIAVAAFLNEQIRFTQIAQVIEKTMENVPNTVADNVADLLKIDKNARIVADEIIKKFQAA